MSGKENNSGDSGNMSIEFQFCIEFGRMGFWLTKKGLRQIRSPVFILCTFGHAILSTPSSLLFYLPVQIPLNSRSCDWLSWAIFIFQLIAMCEFMCHLLALTCFINFNDSCSLALWHIMSVQNMFAESMSNRMRKCAMWGNTNAIHTEFHIFQAFSVVFIHKIGSWY